MKIIWSSKVDAGNSLREDLIYTDIIYTITAKIILPDTLGDLSRETSLHFPHFCDMFVETMLREISGFLSFLDYSHDHIMGPVQL